MVLRITRDVGSGRRVRLLIEGRLDAAFTPLVLGEALALLERDGALDVDLSGVALVDRAGVEALRDLDRAGATIRGCSEPVASILEHEGIGVVRGAAATNGS